MRAYGLTLGLPVEHSTGMDDLTERRSAPSDRAFQELLRKRVRVPKRQLDEQEAEYQKKREALKRQPVKKPA